MSKYLNRPENEDELAAHIAAYGDRKEFTKGDRVTVVQALFGMSKPEPGTEMVVIEKIVPGTPDCHGAIAAAEVGDYLCAGLELNHPQGFVVHVMHSGFLVLSKDYVAPPVQPEEETAPEAPATTPTNDPSLN